MIERKHIGSFIAPCACLIPFGNIAAPSAGEYRVILERVEEEQWTPMALDTLAADQVSPNCRNRHG